MRLGPRSSRTVQAVGHRVTDLSRATLVVVRDDVYVSHGPIVQGQFCHSRCHRSPCVLDAPSSRYQRAYASSHRALSLTTNSLNTIVVMIGTRDVRLFVAQVNGVTQASPGYRGLSITMLSICCVASTVWLVLMVVGVGRTILTKRRKRTFVRRGGGKPRRPELETADNNVTSRHRHPSLDGQRTDADDDSERDGDHRRSTATPEVVMIVNPLRQGPTVAESGVHVGVGSEPHDAAARGLTREKSTGALQSAATLDLIRSMTPRSSKTRLRITAATVRRPSNVRALLRAAGSPVLGPSSTGTGTTDSGNRDRFGLGARLGLGTGASSRVLSPPATANDRSQRLELGTASGTD